MKALAIGLMVIGVIIFLAAIIAGVVVDFDWWFWLLLIISFGLVMAGILTLVFGGTRSSLDKDPDYYVDSNIY